MKLNLKEIKAEMSNVPHPDIAVCSVCGWRGPVSECIVEEDGDWEGGYFNVDTCPKCEDGGEIEYEYSEEAIKEFHL